MPQSDKEFLSLSIGDPTAFPNLQIPDSCSEAIVELVGDMGGSSHNNNLLEESRRFSRFFFFFFFFFSHHRAVRSKKANGYVPSFGEGGGDKW